MPHHDMKMRVIVIILQNIFHDTNKDNVCQFLVKNSSWLKNESQFTSYTVICNSLIGLILILVILTDINGQEMTSSWTDIERYKDRNGIYLQYYDCRQYMWIFTILYLLNQELQLIFFKTSNNLCQKWLKNRHLCNFSEMLYLTMTWKWEILP